MFAVDEIEREEKTAARDKAQQAYSAAAQACQNDVDAATNNADYKAKTEAYVAALNAFAANAQTISAQKEIVKIEKAKKESKQKKAVIDAAKAEKKTAKGATAHLKTKLDEAAKEVPSFVSVHRAYQVAQIKRDLAAAELANFNAQEELEEATAAYEAAFAAVPTDDQAHQAIQAAQKAWEDAMNERRAAKKKCTCDGAELKSPTDSDEAKALFAAREKSDDLYAKLEHEVRPMKNQALDALVVTSDRRRQALLVAKGTQYQPVIDALNALNAVKVSDKSNADAAQKESRAKVKTDAEATLQKAEKVYSKLALAGTAKELGTERYVKLLQQELARIEQLEKIAPNAPFASRCCSGIGFGVGKVVEHIKSIPDAINGAGQSIWQTLVEPAYKENLFQKEALGYAPAATDASKKARLNAFKTALTKQGVDYSRSFGRTVYPSLAFGACAGLAATGMAYKLFGRTRTAAKIGVVVGLGTTVLAGLYLAGLHGIGYVTGAYAERRNHLLKTAKEDGITAGEALQAYNDVCGKDTMKALRKFGYAGLAEMKRLTKQMAAAK